MHDLVVIGGGISGIGVALEASRLSKSTILLEKGEFGSATSKGSLRIMHGGFRYLQTLSLFRVCESIRAQHELLTTYPDLVKPLPCVIPLAKHGFKSKIPVTAALAFYRKLSRSLVGGDWYGDVLSKEDSEKKIPNFNGRFPHGALLWTDAILLDPVKLHSILLEEIALNGALLLPNTRVTRVERKEGGYLVVSERGGKSEEFLAKSVVDASGAWVGSMFRNPRIPRTWSRGFNVVIARQLDPTHGVGIQSKEGRLYFCVPRDSYTAIGTEYLEVDSKDPGSLTIQEDEVVRFLEKLSSGLPGAPLTLKDIVAIDSGILPRSGSAPEELLGSTRFLRKGSFLSLVSTKYTTFLPVGRRAVHLVAN